MSSLFLRQEKGQSYFAAVRVNYENIWSIILAELVQKYFASVSFNELGYSSLLYSNYIDFKYNTTLNCTNISCFDE